MAIAKAHLDRETLARRYERRSDQQSRGRKLLRRLRENEQTKSALEFRHRRPLNYLHYYARFREQHRNRRLDNIWLRFATRTPLPPDSKDELASTMSANPWEPTPTAFLQLLNRAYLDEMAEAHGHEHSQITVFMVDVDMGGGEQLRAELPPCVFKTKDGHLAILHCNECGGERFSTPESLRNHIRTVEKLPCASAEEAILANFRLLTPDEIELVKRLGPRATRQLVQRCSIRDLNDQSHLQLRQHASGRGAVEVDIHGTVKGENSLILKQMKQDMQTAKRTLEDLEIITKGDPQQEDVEHRPTALLNALSDLSGARSLFSSTYSIQGSPTATCVCVAIKANLLHGGKTISLSRYQKRPGRLLLADVQWVGVSRQAMDVIRCQLQLLLERLPMAFDDLDDGTISMAKDAITLSVLGQQVPITLLQPNFTEENSTWFLEIPIQAFTSDTRREHLNVSTVTADLSFDSDFSDCDAAAVPALPAWFTAVEPTLWIPDDVVPRATQEYAVRFAHWLQSLATWQVMEPNTFSRFVNSIFQALGGWPKYDDKSRPWSRLFRVRRLQHHYQIWPRIYVQVAISNANGKLPPINMPLDITIVRRVAEKIETAWCKTGNLKEAWLEGLREADFQSDEFVELQSLPTVPYPCKCTDGMRSTTLHRCDRCRLYRKCSGMQKLASGQTFSLFCRTCRVDLGLEDLSGDEAEAQGDAEGEAHGEGEGEARTVATGRKSKLCDICGTTVISASFARHRRTCEKKAESEGKTFTPYVRVRVQGTGSTRPRKLCDICDTEISGNKFAEHRRRCEKKAEAEGKTFTPYSRRTAATGPQKLCDLCDTNVATGYFAKHRRRCEKKAKAEGKTFTAYIRSFNRRKLCDLCNTKVVNAGFATHRITCEEKAKAEGKTFTPYLLGRPIDPSRAKLCDLCNTYISKTRFAKHRRTCEEKARAEGKAFTPHPSRGKLCDLCNTYISKKEFGKHRITCERRAKAEGKTFTPYVRVIGQQTYREFAEDAGVPLEQLKWPLFRRFRKVVMGEARTVPIPQHEDSCGEDEDLDELNPNDDAANGEDEDLDEVNPNDYAASSEDEDLDDSDQDDDAASSEDEDLDDSDQDDDAASSEDDDLDDDIGDDDSSSEDEVPDTDDPDHDDAKGQDDDLDEYANSKDDDLDKDDLDDEHDEQWAQNIQKNIAADALAERLDEQKRLQEELEEAAEKPSIDKEYDQMRKTATIVQEMYEQLLISRNERTMSLKSRSGNDLSGMPWGEFEVMKHQVTQSLTAKGSNTSEYHNDADKAWYSDLLIHNLVMSDDDHLAPNVEFFSLYDAAVWFGDSTAEEVIDRFNAARLVVETYGWEAESMPEGMFSDGSEWWEEHPPMQYPYWAESQHFKECLSAMPSITPTTSRIVLCCRTTMHIIAVCIEPLKGKVTLFNSYPDTNIGGWGRKIVESLLGLLCLKPGNEHLEGKEWKYDEKPRRTIQKGDYNCGVIAVEACLALLRGDWPQAVSHHVRTYCAKVRKEHFDMMTQAAKLAMGENMDLD